MIVEQFIKKQGGCVTSEDLDIKHWRLSCCHVWWKFDLIDDVLNDLRLVYFDSTILEYVYHYENIILYIALVIDI